MKKNDSSKKKSNQKMVSQKNLKYFLHLDKIDEQESKDNIKMENKKYKTGEKKIYSFYTLKGKSTKNIREFKIKSNFKKPSLFKSEKKLNFLVSDFNDSKSKSSPFKMNRSNIIKNTEISNFSSIDNDSKYNRRSNIVHKKMFNKSSKNILSFKNKLGGDEDDNDFNTISYQGIRRSYLAVRKNKSDKKKIVQFSTIKYLKSTKSTSVAGKDSGKKKVNQDSYISEINVNGILNFNVFGVLDGHGVNGHLASQFVKRYILNRIKNLEIVKNSGKPIEIYNYLKEERYKIINDIFTDADIQIQKQNFDCDLSGTTCTLVIQLEEHIICANAGDSRAILVFNEKEDELLENTKIYLLSYDSKPQNPKEKKRIIEHGGLVLQDLNEFRKPEGPFRVWIKGEHYPGISLSRSIGDIDAKKIGVIPNPEIIEYNLNPKSKYMIICSDGIWEYITNEQAMIIGNKYYLKNDPLGLCKELTEKSNEIWMKESEDGDVDDITVVAVFF